MTISENSFSRTADSAATQSFTYIPELDPSEYMPKLPEGFYWNIRQIVPAGGAKKKVFIFLKKEGAPDRELVTFQIAAKFGKIIEDPTCEELFSAGESMLSKASTRAALGLTAPLR